jgi:hypothetical protein
MAGSAERFGPARRPRGSLHRGVRLDLRGRYGGHVRRQRMWRRDHPECGLPGRRRSRPSGRRVRRARPARPSSSAVVKSATRSVLQSDLSLRQQVPVRETEPSPRRTSRSSPPSAAARSLAHSKTRSPRQSQNRVRVISTTTVACPGLVTSRSPACSWPVVMTSISAGLALFESSTVPGTQLAACFFFEQRHGQQFPIYRAIAGMGPAIGAADQIGPFQRHLVLSR